MLLYTESIFLLLVNCSISAFMIFCRDLFSQDYQCLMSQITSNKFSKHLSLHSNKRSSIAISNQKIFSLFQNSIHQEKYRKSKSLISVLHAEKAKRSTNISSLDSTEHPRLLLVPSTVWQLTCEVLDAYVLNCIWVIRFFLGTLNMTNCVGSKPCSVSYLLNSLIRLSTKTNFIIKLIINTFLKTSINLSRINRSNLRSPLYFLII